jgi:hypothetical protein
MRLRFTIRDLLGLTALIAMGFGWWADHQYSIKKWSSVHGWSESASPGNPPIIRFSRGNTVDGAHLWQGTVEFPKD